MMQRQVDIVSVFDAIIAYHRAQSQIMATVSAQVEYKEAFDKSVAAREILLKVAVIARGDTMAKQAIMQRLDAINQAALFDDEFFEEVNKEV